MTSLCVLSFLHCLFDALQARRADLTFFVLHFFPAGVSKLVYLHNMTRLARRSSQTAPGPTDHRLAFVGRGGGGGSTLNPAAVFKKPGP